jgi:hypothetical protein
MKPVTAASRLLLEESGKNTIWNICDNTEESGKNTIWNICDNT